MKSLTWNQVNAWRLAQHGLAPRLKREKFVEVTSRLYGIHAQVMSAAELALGARTDGLTPESVQSALWQDRTLVKTWPMRGTLHLLAADDLPLHAAARRIDPRNWIDFESHGVSEKQREAFLEAVPEVLGSEPMTREQLAAAVAEQKVFRQQGWTTAVVLVDGIIKGVWDYKMKEAQTTVTVEMFDPPRSLSRRASKQKQLG